MAKARHASQVELYQASHTFEVIEGLMHSGFLRMFSFTANQLIYIV